jgi:membrane-associated phospholipid phosphatase
VTPTRIWGRVLVAAGALALSVALDPWVWRQVTLAGVYERDWGRMLRVVGSLVFWAPLALAVWLALRRANPPRPGRDALVVWGPALAGGVAELLKLAVRRERPGFADGQYVFRDFAERTWSTSGLGFPTSHGMVAFGGAAVLAGLFPGTAPVAYVLAAGCAITRILAGAHFASDAVGGAIFGWAIGAFLWRRFGALPLPNR